MFNILYTITGIFANNILVLRSINVLGVYTCIYRHR